MGKVINLRTIRKQKSRDDDREKSRIDTQSAGIKKPERARVVQINRLSDRQLDGHKREDET